MKERPILFSAPMVRALLDGTKTQTRRVVKMQPERVHPGVLMWPMSTRGHAYGELGSDSPARLIARCPYGQPGERMWVRETWAHHVHAQSAARDEEGPFVYAADGERALRMRMPSKWTPGIHMFRWASRITLGIAAVRVERLQDISEEDARAEGAPGYEEGVDAPPPDGEHEWSYRASFRRLWESINGPGSWEANPWVWVVEFRRL